MYKQSLHFVICSISSIELNSFQLKSKYIMFVPIIAGNKPAMSLILEKDKSKRVRFGNDLTIGIKAEISNPKLFDKHNLVKDFGKDDKNNLLWLLK